VDLEGAPCKGGYLNSVEPNSCPLDCSPRVESIPQQYTVHVPYPTPVQYDHNPPASGPHWPWHTTWGPHPEVVPREFWVHNLEHGGIALLFNCPGPPPQGPPPDAGGIPVNGCPNEVAQMVNLWATHRADDWEDMAPPTVRIVITADPLLPTRFAAVAWDWVFTMDTFDLPAVQCFIDARYGKGPEEAP
jgi:hypothetical protein